MPANVVVPSGSALRESTYPLVVRAEETLKTRERDGMRTGRDGGLMVLSSGTAKIVVDDGACVGCKICELICSLHHEGAFHPFLSRIQVVRDPFAGHNVPTVCAQCQHPACVDACPEDAIGVNPLTGVVVIREEACTGCGCCADACPFNTEKHVLRYHPQKKVYLKCDLCDGDPQCVAWCPSGALTLRPAGKEGA